MVTCTGAVSVPLAYGPLDGHAEPGPFNAHQLARIDEAITFPVSRPGWCSRCT